SSAPSEPSTRAAFDSSEPRSKDNMEPRNLGASEGRIKLRCGGDLSAVGGGGEARSAKERGARREARGARREHKRHPERGRRMATDEGSSIRGVRGESVAWADPREGS